MKKKAFIIMMLFIICLLACVACKKSVGTPEDNAMVEEEDEETEEGPKIVKIGFSMIDMENPYFLTLESAAKDALKNLNASDESVQQELITKDPGTDPSLQANQIQEMIEDGISAIILSPVDWEKITPSLQKLKDADVKIINVDTQVREMEYVDAYIGSDNHKAGYICGENLIRRCPKGCKIAILECPTQNSINERITGFEEALTKAKNGFEVVARADTYGEFEKALNATREILSKHPDIVAIMCGNDQIAVGATTAVNVAELKDILIYGVDGSQDIKKELQKSESQVVGTAAQSPIHIGQTAVEITVKAINEKEYEKETYEDVFMIDKHNVKMYGADGWQ